MSLVPIEFSHKRQLERSQGSSKSSHVRVTCETTQSFNVRQPGAVCTLPGARNSDIKRTGVLVRNFEKNPQEDTQKSYFSAQYPERYRKSSRCGPFETEHPKKYQNRVLTPERYDKHPRRFYMGVPPSPPPSHTHTGCTLS